MQINGNTRLIDMTLEELFQAIDERNAEREKKREKSDARSCLWSDGNNASISVQQVNSSKDIA